MLRTLMTGLILFLAFSAFAGNSDSLRAARKADARLIKQFKKQLDSTQRKIKFLQGKILLAEGQAELNIPAGFKFIDSTESRFILENLWGNIPDNNVIGMIVHENFKLNHAENDFSYVISYQQTGFITDDYADDPDTSSLLSGLQKDQDAANLIRTEAGYNTMNIVGWTKEPTYNSERNIIQWAKEVSIKGAEINILNYESKLLGRNGIIGINAVAAIDKLDAIKKELPIMLNSIHFQNGYQYKDFKKSGDRVSALTIKGLIAGRPLSKTGFWSGRSFYFNLAVSLLLLLTSGVLIFNLSKRKARTQHA